MRLTIVSLTLVAVLVGLVASASPAGAHARYERSEPSDGAVLEQSPPRVDVWFNQEVTRREGLPTMIVVNDTGDTVSVETVLDDADRTHMYADLAPALPDGRYTVIWHTLSDEDGEEAQGAFHFYVGRGPEQGAETPTAQPSPASPSPKMSPTTPAPEMSNGENGGASTAAVIGIALAAAAVGMLVGGGLGAMISRRR